MLDCALNRMNRAIKIEVDVPLTWLSFLVKKMEHYVAAILLVKPASCVFVIGKATRKVSAPLQSRFDHGPGEELDSNTSLPINIRHLTYELP